jgi:hypothetical protein
MMSRAGVRADIAERSPAHCMGGVRGVYDRYAYDSREEGVLRSADDRDQSDRASMNGHEIAFWVQWWGFLILYAPRWWRTLVETNSVLSVHVVHGM